MPQKPDLKICLVGECLSTGGAERTMAALSRFLTANGVNVSTVIVLDSVTYEFEGDLLNLGKFKDAANGLRNKLKRAQILRHFLREKKFDCIIDFRIRRSFLQELLTRIFLYDAPVIYTIHSSNMKLYLPKPRWKARLLYKNARALVCVSNEIAQLVKDRYQLKNVQTIYNPVDIAAIESQMHESIPVSCKFIVAAGSMKSTIKQFDKLIEAYAASALPAQYIKLIVLGDGELKSGFQKLAESLGLSEMVVFPGFVQNPFAWFSRADFYVLSSQYEGLPTVLLESLCCGTPVVSFDCKSGPNEIVIHKQNGLLVADQDFEALIQALDLMVADEKLKEICSQNAKASVAKFSLDQMGADWLRLLKKP